MGRGVLEPSAMSLNDVYAPCARVHLVVKDQESDVRVLNTLEFDSTRKRMSVLIKLPNGGIRALVKGADSAIYDVLRTDTDEVGCPTYSPLCLSYLFIRWPPVSYACCLLRCSILTLDPINRH